MAASLEFSPNTPLGDALVILGAAGIVIPVFARIRITPVIGFILVGLVVGPFGLGQLVLDHPWLAYVTISDPAGLGPFAEFGIILLLFSIGLELSFSRLWQMRRQVFGLGALEMIFCSVIIATGLVMIGNSAATAIAIGLALALSSTALVLRITDPRTPAGRAALSMLLFEDIALVPIIFLLGAMGRGDAATGPDELLRTLWLGGLVVAGLLIAGRFLLPSLFSLAARTKSPEPFLAASLLVVIVSALATGAVGLSPIVGALIAGLLIAETEYHGEVETITAPFKGLALGVFLITVGMSLDLGFVLENLGAILIGLVSVLGVKAAVTGLLLRLMGARPGTATETGILMASPSETTLIVLTAAIAARLISDEAAQYWQVVTALGLTVTPLLALVGRRLGRRVDRQVGDIYRPEMDPEAEHAIVIGYGRVGQLVVDMLAKHNQAYVAVDYDPDLVAIGLTKGCNVVYGDAGQTMTLSRLGPDHATCFILTMDEPVMAQRLTRRLRTEFPDVPIIVRARDASHAAALYRLGASHAVPETLESSLQLSEAVLVDLGIPMGFVIASIHEKRDEFREKIMEEGELTEKPRLKSAGLRERNEGNAG